MSNLTTNGSLAGVGSNQNAVSDYIDTNLYDQTLRSPVKESLVKKQFENVNAEQKTKLADSFIDLAGKSGIVALTQTVDGQYALKEVFSYASEIKRDVMRDAHEDVGSTAVNFTDKKDAEFFNCQCIAVGGGVTNNEGIKECSYDCTCVVTTKDGVAVSADIVNIDKVETTAYSLQHWDPGSRICHGQYGYRPNSKAPNWEIETKFDQFIINQDGDLKFSDKPVVVGNGVSQSDFPRVQTATEISNEIKEQLFR
jgi:hypothetical protein